MSKPIIQFFNEDAKLPTSLKKSLLKKSLIDLSETHNTTIKNLTYIFCSDDYLLNINKQFLNHDYYTDIITFPYHEGTDIEGEIYVSLDRITDNAIKQKVLFENELFRVIAHGLLHLIGFSDKTPKQKKLMREEEDKAITIFYSTFTP